MGRESLKPWTSTLRLEDARIAEGRTANGDTLPSMTLPIEGKGVQHS